MPQNIWKLKVLLWTKRNTVKLSPSLSLLKAPLSFCMDNQEKEKKKNGLHTPFVSAECLGRCVYRFLPAQDEHSPCKTLSVGGRGKPGWISALITHKNISSHSPKPQRAWLNV